MKEQLEQPSQHRADLRRRLSLLALSLRESMAEDADLRQPRVVEEDLFFEGGQAHWRKRIILRSAGCSAATCTMCPFTNETLYETDRTSTISAETYITQFENAFSGEDTLDKYQIVSVYNDGNFFAKREMPPEVRQHIYKRVVESQCQTLMVESLPQFVTKEFVEEAKQILGDKKLIVGIGLQSADNLVRELCINTTCTKRGFERAVELLYEYECIPKIYLMVKPPFLTEEEGIQDAVSSLRYLYSQGLKEATLCPTRISPHTVASELYKQGAYTPPWLWSVVEILRQTHKEGSPRVACVNLRSTDFVSIHPGNCDLCSDELVERIEKFNTSRDFRPVEEISCSCFADYQRFLRETRDERPLEKRVEDFLATCDRL
jgi:radical SAM enzyme (TIGR01210 family)